MAFKPGQSGNPTGRPKKSNPAAMLAKEHAEEAIGYQVKVMRDSAEKTENRLKASEYIVTRAYGKPVEAVEITGEDGGPIENTFTVLFKRSDASGISGET